jgi:hypothetical protein
LTYVRSEHFGSKNGRDAAKRNRLSCRMKFPDHSLNFRVDRHLGALKAEVAKVLGSAEPTGKYDGTHVRIGLNKTIQFSD